MRPAQEIDYNQHYRQAIIPCGGADSNEDFLNICNANVDTDPAWNSRYRPSPENIMDNKHVKKGIINEHTWEFNRNIGKLRIPQLEECIAISDMLKANKCYD